jgi:peptidoglycan/xylan/chitin deacetylase (PgdA/CDA1 family)
MNEFDRDVEPEEAICSWEDLRRLQAGGISIQSHAASHRAFSELTAEEQVAELRDSKDAIEASLGETVALFSFPYGDPGQDAQATATRLEEAGYEAAFCYGGGILRLPVTDRFLLPRIAVGPDSDLRSEIRDSHDRPT